MAKRTSPPRLLPERELTEAQGAPRGANVVPLRSRKRAPSSHAPLRSVASPQAATEAALEPAAARKRHYAPDDRAVAGLPSAAPGKRDVYHDPDPSLAGLTLRVTSTGAKSWTVERWHAGRTWKWALGSFDPTNERALTVASARRKARRVLDELADGNDPRQADRERRQKARAAAERATGKHTVAALAAQFLERRDSYGAGERWRYEQAGYFARVVLPAWGARDVAAITPSDVMELLDPIAAEHPHAANRCFAILQRFFRWAAIPRKVGNSKRYERILDKLSPCEGLEAPGGVERSRDRVLDDGELAKVWHAADDVPKPYGDVIRFAVLTGCRYAEIVGARWSDVDHGAKALAVPRTKAGVPFVLPLNPMALGIITTIRDERRIDAAPDGLIFAATPGVRPKSWWRAVDAIVKRTGIEFRGHDLRRTVRTGLSRLGVSPDVAERVIGHTVGSKVSRTYDRYSHLDEKRAALGLWEAHVAKVVGKEAR